MTGYMLPLASVLLRPWRVVAERVYVHLLRLFFFRHFSDLTIPSKGSVTATVVRFLYGWPNRALRGDSKGSITATVVRLLHKWPNRALRGVSKGSITATAVRLLHGWPNRALRGGSKGFVTAIVVRLLHKWPNRALRGGSKGSITATERWGLHTLLLTRPCLRSGCSESLRLSQSGYP